MSGETLPAPEDRAEAIELLALVATLSHTAFSRLAADAVDAPDVSQRLELSRVAAGAVARRDRVLDRLAELGGDPVAQIERFERMLADFDARTQPASWWERLLKGYVGYGVSDDFCRMAAWGVDQTTRELVLDVLSDPAHEELSVTALSDACADDESLNSRLALWSRRVVGESLQIVSRLLTVHPALARSAAKGLLATRPVADQVPGTPETVQDEQPDPSTQTGTDPSKVLNELTAEHSRRMSRLKMTA